MYNRKCGCPEWGLQGGNCLFIFAMVCKGWRKAQIAVGGRLRTRVWSDVILPGRVALAKWALAEGCPRELWNTTITTTIGGTQVGDPVRRRIHTMPELAALHGHLELVQWLYGEQGFEPDLKMMQNAARSGNLELVQWLWGEGSFAVDRKVIERAVRSGNLELVQWLCGEGGFEMDEKVLASVVYSAAGGGDFELVKWLIKEQGFAMDVEVMDWAAGSGNLQLVQWMRSEGCPWNKWTCQSAVDASICARGENGGSCVWPRPDPNGPVEVLRWARKNGCEWDIETRDRAAAKLGYTDNFGNLYQ